MSAEVPVVIAGPYEPPACKVGDWISDEVEGLLEVGGWTAAPISWPRRKKTGRASLILTPELARAVRVESVEAICYWWGVRPTKVWMWRKALGVDRVTEGTRKLLQERTGVPPDAARRGRRRAASPESRAKMAATKRGRAAHPNTRAALLKAARRKKPQDWGVAANAWMRGVRLPRLRRGEWTAGDLMRLRDEYLRGRSARAIALILGRTAPAVTAQIDVLGLPAVGRKKWKTRK